MTIVMVIFACAFFLYKLYDSSRSFFHEENRFKLYGLRDKLRQQAIDGVIEHKNWLFDYLDSTITKVAVKLPELSIYNLIGLYFIHKNDEKLQISFKNLQNELKKEENKSFEETMNEFTEILACYFMSRHILLVRSFIWKNRLQQKIKKTIDFIRVLPETSTLTYA